MKWQVESRRKLVIDCLVSEDEERERVAGCEGSYSGAGFGERDMGWDCATELEADKLAERLRLSFPTDYIRVRCD